MSGWQARTAVRVADTMAISLFFFWFVVGVKAAILNLVSREVSEISRRRAIRHTYFHPHKKRNYSHKYVQINISRRPTV